jgi:ComF family protein
MAALIAEAVKNYELDYDLAVPIPIHYVRRCLRGFNQAELLASSLPHLSFLSLSRTRNTRPQVSLSREARLVNLKNAFSASASVSGKRILLVDDVATTGGTALAAAEALVNAGATGVGLIAFAGNP